MAYPFGPVHCQDKDESKKIVESKIVSSNRYAFNPFIRESRPHFPDNTLTRSIEKEFSVYIIVFK